MELQTYRKCPVCSASTASLVKAFDFQLFEKHPMSLGYKVVQCNKCGFVFADTRVGQDELDFYYKELSKYEDKNIGTGGGFTPQDKARLEGVAEFLSDHVPRKDARILDLGCASGGLLKELKIKGFTNLVGIDPSEACVEITTAEVGCEVYQFSLFDIDQSVGKFDLIILSHVLEHLLDVKGTLDLFERLINDNGLIYIECPNAQHYNDVIHAPYQEFNTEHINHFNEQALRNLFGMQGYEILITGDKILKIASDQDYHAVYGLFKKRRPEQIIPIDFDNGILANIKDYLQKSEAIYKPVLEEIDKIDNDEPIALYGIGQFAFKLLNEPVLKNKQQVKLFDSNPMNFNKSINKITIMPGDRILEEYQLRPFTIVITSLIHEKAITAYINGLFENAAIKKPRIIGFSRFLDL